MFVCSTWTNTRDAVKTTVMQQTEGNNNSEKAAEMNDSDSDTSAYFPKPEENLSGKKRELPDDCRHTYVPSGIVSE